MKLNIQKFQGGGTGLGSLFSAVQVAAPSALEQKSEKSENSSPILSESTLNKLRSLEYGLPNELDQFEIELATLEQKLSSGRRVSPREIADIRAKAGRIVAQAGHLKKAEEFVEKNDALDDIAIDHKGSIYAITDKGVEKILFSKYDPEKHQALTYSELIEYRRQSPQLINNADVIASISRGIGVEKINSYIQDILDKVGQSETKQEAIESLGSIYGSAVKNMSVMEFAAIKDLYAIKDKVGMDMLLKTTKVSKDSNLQHAWQYIMSVLPKNMRSQLEATYMVNTGGSYSDAKKYVGEVIETAALMTRESKQEYGIDYQQDINTAGGTKSGSKVGGSSKSYYDSPLETFFNGNMNQDKITISDPDSKNQYGLEVQGNTWGQLVDLNGNVKSNLPLSVALNESLGQFLDFSQVYLGDQKVNSSELQNVAYENAQIAQVWLPVTGPNKDIDWRRIKAFAKAEKQIQELGYTNISDKNKVHAANDSYMRYNDQGELVPQSQQTERFLMTHGYTIDDLAENTSLAKELTGVDEDAASALIDSIYAKDRVKKQYGISDIRSRNGYDDIMKLPIFIRISPTASSDVKIAAKHGPLQTPHTEEEFMVQQKINESDYIQADSSMI